MAGRNIEKITIIIMLAVAVVTVLAVGTVALTTALAPDPGDKPVTTTVQNGEDVVPSTETDDGTASLPVTDKPVDPVTEPPVTEPPVTEPPKTEPPKTEPPITQPPVTEPPVTSDPTVTTDPVVTTELTVTTDPVITTEPTITTEPIVTTEPATDPYEPVIDVPSSGSFYSSNPESIKLYVEWETVKADDSNADITVRVYLESKELRIRSERYGTLTIGDQNYAFASPSSIYHPAGNEASRTIIYETTVRLTDVTAGNELTVSVVWNCNVDSYGGRRINSLTASATITLN